MRAHPIGRWWTAAACMGVLAAPGVARAWPTGGCVAGPFRVHADIAAHVLDHPEIAPYLAPLGLSRDAIVAAAAVEPQCSFGSHPGWGDLRDLVHLDWEVSDTTAGIILHVGGDSGVPSCHSPANEVYCDNLAETRVESDGELAGVPPLGDLYPGDFAEQAAAFHDEAVANATAFRTYVETTWSCPLACSTTPYAVAGMIAGQKFAHAALLVWLRRHLPELPDAGTDGGDDEADGGEVVEPDAAADGGIDAPPDGATDAEAGAEAPGGEGGADVPPDLAEAGPDAGPSDAAGEAAEALLPDGEADAPAGGGGGCGCRAGGAAGAAGLIALPAVLVLGLAGGRRRGRGARGSSARRPWP